MSIFNTTKNVMIPEDKALQGRDEPIATAEVHHVFGVELKRELNPQEKVLIVGMGCFWGAERRFWQLHGVTLTAAGYSAGYTQNPTYEEVCTGKTGHNEVVRVVYDTSKISLEALLREFWQAHNPTQGMRQGNDNGTQYRSGLYLTDSADLAVAEGSRANYQKDLQAAGYPKITTEIALASDFFYAEDYHQQYLSKNPQGYCGLGGTGVTCR